MILNVSCSTLMNPQEQPVEIIDGKANIYSTTCSGLAKTSALAIRRLNEIVSGAMGIK